jgi:hypothetical protein
MCAFAEVTQVHERESDFAEVANAFDEMVDGVVGK